MAHILSEKKRRNNINSGFLELKGIVPNCRDSSDSKASILKKAVQYIQSLEKEQTQFKHIQPTNLSSPSPSPSPPLTIAFKPTINQINTGVKPALRTTPLPK
ncbi:1495_t:CDS:2 [Entrophospora sp. SA101]|nr:1495_t:CDS:2 [Entrophospora sp. SA101]